MKKVFTEFGGRPFFLAFIKETVRLTNDRNSYKQKTYQIQQQRQTPLKKINV